MFSYILKSGTQFILLQHAQRFSQEEFDTMVEEYRYAYKGELYQNEYDIQSVAEDLEREEGFIPAPMVSFGR